MTTVPSDYNGNETNRFHHNSHPPYRKGVRPADQIHQFILGVEHKNKAGTDNIKTHTGTDRREAQQTDASSAATTDLQQESNTNTETWAPDQEAEIVVAKIKISDIKIGKRFRKDLGNTDELAESIRKNHLIYPVIVKKDNLLVDGARRMKAYKKLNRQDIPVIVRDVRIKEDAEIEANLVKDFTIKEKVDIKRYRESTEPNLQGQPNDLKLPGKFPRSDNKQRRDERIAESTGVSYKTLQKAEKVVDAAQKNPEKFDHLLSKIDSGQMSVSKASKIIERENMRQDILEKAHAQTNYNDDSDNLKLYCGDFRDVCRAHIPDSSINLIFTDPPYSREHLHLYQPLGNEAFRMLKKGGHLVVYAAHYALPEIFDYMKNSGLEYWWVIVVKHTGPSARVFSKNVVVTYKPLLWFTKGAKPKILDFVEDSVESKPPDKSLHPWAQSTVEAEYVISKLTIPNDVVLDCTMGTGTTGIAALKLKRRFIGIEKNAETLAIARHNISQIISSAQRLQGDNTN